MLYHRTRKCILNEKKSSVDAKCYSKRNQHLLAQGMASKSTLKTFVIVEQDDIGCVLYEQQRIPLKWRQQTLNLPSSRLAQVDRTFPHTSDRLMVRLVQHMTVIQDGQWL